MTIYSFDVLLFLFGTSLLFHVNSGGGLLILMGFSGPLNLASDGFLVVPPFVSNCCPLELRESHGSWNLTYKKWVTKEPRWLGTSLGPTQFQFQRVALTSSLSWGLWELL